MFIFKDELSSSTFLSFTTHCHSGLMVMHMLGKVYNVMCGFYRWNATESIDKANYFVE